MPEGYSPKADDIFYTSPFQAPPPPFLPDASIFRKSLYTLVYTL